MADMPEQPPGGFPDTPEGRWEREKWKKAFEEWERWNPIEPIKGTPRPEPEPDPDPKEIKWIDGPKLANALTGVLLFGTAVVLGIATVAAFPVTGTATVVIVGVGLMGAGSAEAGQPEETPATSEPPADDPGPGPGTGGGPVDPNPPIEPAPIPHEPTHTTETHEPPDDEPEDPPTHEDPGEHVD